jgi:hypothetical protein
MTKERTMTDLEAKETIEAMRWTAESETTRLKERIAKLEEEYADDQWEETAAQIRRLGDRLVVRGLQAEALAIAASKFGEGQE